MFSRKLIFVLLCTSSVAIADPLTADEMHVVEPDRTADRAEFKPGRLAWCPAGKFAGEAWDHGRLRRATASAITSIERTPGEAKMGDGPTLEALEHLCQFPDDAGWQKQVMYLYQAVMNSQNVTQDEAVELVKTWVG